MQPAGWAMEPPGAPRRGAMVTMEASWVRSPLRVLLSCCLGVRWDTWGLAQVC